MTDVERWTLANGMTILYRRDAGFPLASATLLFRAGSRQESHAEAGLCSMTIDLLLQGTRRHNARQIARVLESVGASLGTQAHEDFAEMGFVVPASEMDRVLDITAEVLQEPSFPPAEIVKEKAHVLASLASRKDSIFNVAYDALNQAMYDEHPYGRPLEGRPETVKRFRRADFKQWHGRHLRPERAIFSLVGPMPGKETARLIEKHLSRWKGPRQLHPSTPSSPLKGEERKVKQLMVRSHFKQAYLMLGFPAPEAAHPGQIPLKVLNTLLGGGMSSRLFVSLREKLGLAYEVSSFYPTRQDVSQWVIYLGLPAEKLETASQRLEDLLQDLGRRGPPVKELRQAQAMIRGAFLMDQQSRRRQAWYRAWWEFLGRGDRYGEEFLGAVDAVRPEDLLHAARQILAQPRVTVMVVPK